VGLKPMSCEQVQAGDDSTWVWSQVHDLTAQVTALREQLAESQASVDVLTSQLSAAEAAAAAQKALGSDGDLLEQRTKEVDQLREDLAAAEQEGAEHHKSVSLLRSQLAELQTALANEQMRQEEGARAVAESCARERALEEELTDVRADLVKAQRSLVAKAEASEKLTAPASDVAARALVELRQGVANLFAFSVAHNVAQAAAASNDEWLLREVKSVVVDLQHSSGVGGGKENVASEAMQALQRDLEVMQDQKQWAEKARIDARIEIEQLYDKLDDETEAREKADATCEELRKKLQDATSTHDDLQKQLQICRQCALRF
jgi:chromosome segregation ATPase